MLWSGVPMVTLTGPDWEARVGTSLAHAAGMTDLVVNTVDQYEQKAVMLATNRALLAQYRKRLESTRTTAPLFDTERWVRNFEAGIRIVHQARLERDGQQDAVGKVKGQLPLPKYVLIPDVQEASQS